MLNQALRTLAKENECKEQRWAEAAQRRREETRTRTIAVAGAVGAQIGSDLAGMYDRLPPVMRAVQPDLWQKRQVGYTVPSMVFLPSQRRPKPSTRGAQHGGSRSLSGSPR